MLEFICIVLYVRKRLCMEYFVVFSLLDLLVCNPDLYKFI